MSKTILIDIDDTIENLCETWVDWLNKQYGTSVEYNKITEWDTSKFFPNLTKEQVFEPLHNPKLWDYVQPKPGAVEYVKKLIDEGYNVYMGKLLITEISRRLSHYSMLICGLTDFLVKTYR